MQQCLQAQGTPTRDPELGAGRPTIIGVSPPLPRVCDLTSITYLADLSFLPFLSARHLSFFRSLRPLSATRRIITSS